MKALRLFTLYTLLQLSLAFSADNPSPLVGHWELNMGLGEAAFISMLALDADGTFRQTTRKPNDPKPLLDYNGKYTIKDDVLELHFTPNDGREHKPMTMKWKRDPDTLWLSDMAGSEKMPYRLLSLTASAAEPLPAKTPSEAAKTYYETLNKGVQADIEKLMSAASLAAESAFPPDIRQIRKAGMEAATKYHTVTKVEVLKENIQGKRAWVDVRLHYKDGTSQVFNCGFTVESGTWKTTSD